MFSREYADLLSNGPFPGRIDPWSETARYFHQIHSGMINHILEQLRIPLLRRGYVAGKEASLQIIDGQQPDIYVQRAIPDIQDTSAAWDYVTAATEVVAEPGRGKWLWKLMRFILRQPGQLNL